MRRKGILPITPTPPERLPRAGAGAVLKLHGAPQRLTIDVDATLITAHSEKENAAGNYKGGYGFHPLQALRR